MKDNKKKLSAVENVMVDFTADIQKPTMKEDKRGGFIKYGSDNLYPDFLLDLFINKSNKHNSIITRKVNMATGQGFSNVMTPELSRFVDNFRGSHPLDDMVKLLNTDFEVFNAFALIARWNLDKTKVVSLDYVPVHKVRLGVEEDTFFVSDNWQHYKKVESNTRMYRKIDGKPVPENATKEEQRLALSQMIYHSEMTIGSDYYPNVGYQSAINYILADYEIGKFTINNIKSNFVGGYQLHFEGEVPEAHERAAIKRAFLAEYTGSEASSVVMTWGDEGNKVTLTPLPTSGNEGAFLEVEHQVRTNIFIAHSVVNPMLFGIQEAGSLGGRDELQESLEIFQTTSIRPRQLSLENVLNRVLRINGVNDEIKLGEYTFVDKEEEAVEEVINETETI